MQALRSQAKSNLNVVQLIHQARTLIQLCESGSATQEDINARNSVLLEMFLFATGIKRRARQGERVSRTPAVLAFGLNILYPLVTGGPQLSNMLQASDLLGIHSVSSSPAPASFVSLAPFLPAGARCLLTLHCTAVPKPPCARHIHGKITIAEAAVVPLLSRSVCQRSGAAAAVAALPPCLLLSPAPAAFARIILTAVRTAGPPAGCLRAAAGMTTTAVPPTPPLCL